MIKMTDEKQDRVTKAFVFDEKYCVWSTPLSDASPDINFRSKLKI